jgi:hypothetical protein
MSGSAVPCCCGACGGVEVEFGRADSLGVVSFI